MMSMATRYMRQAVTRNLIFLLCSCLAFLMNAFVCKFSLDHIGIFVSLQGDVMTLKYSVPSYYTFGLFSSA